MDIPLDGNLDQIEPALQTIYVCGECGKTYPLRTSLRRHIKIVHEQKRYQCEKCGRLFTTNHQRKVHVGSLTCEKIKNQVNKTTSTVTSVTATALSTLATTTTDAGLQVFMEYPNKLTITKIIYFFASVFLYTTS